MIFDLVVRILDFDMESFMIPPGQVEFLKAPRAILCNAMVRL